MVRGVSPPDFMPCGAEKIAPLRNWFSFQIVFYPSGWVRLQAVLSSKIPKSNRSRRPINSLVWIFKSTV
ncbi:MAG: hypothetical protein JWQ96_1895 [Segetibacter sp.]|nr:hypothetical protein [Segetibacter sp.]